jgi:hypothetical protein
LNCSWGLAHENGIGFCVRMAGYPSSTGVYDLLEADTLITLMKYLEVTLMIALITPLIIFIGIPLFMWAVASYLVTAGERGWLGK